MDKETPACLCPHVQLGCQHSSAHDWTPEEQGSQPGGKAQASTRMGSCPYILAKGPCVLEAGEPVPTSYASWVALGKRLSPPWASASTLKGMIRSAFMAARFSPSPAARKTAFPRTQVGSVPFAKVSRSRPPWSTHRAPGTATATECQCCAPSPYAPPHIIITTILRGVCPYSHFPQEKIKPRER